MMAGCAAAAAGRRGPPATGVGSTSRPSCASATSRTSPTRPRSSASRRASSPTRSATSKLTTQVFNAGPAAIEALSAGAIDATYIGPNPSINTFIQSGGRVGAHRRRRGHRRRGARRARRHRRPRRTSRARPSPRRSSATRRTSRCASGSPTRASTTDTTGGGDVHITPTENAQTLTLFQQGALDGAWLPEPWVSRLIVDAGAHVLVDEADLWEDGEFPTTVLLVRAEFLDEHPETSSRTLLEGHVAAVAVARRQPRRGAGRDQRARSRRRRASRSPTRSSPARSSTSRSRSTRTPTRSRRSSRTASRRARRRTARSTGCSTCAAERLLEPGDEPSRPRARRGLT